MVWLPHLSEVWLASHWQESFWAWAQPMGDDVSHWLSLYPEWSKLYTIESHYNAVQSNITRYCTHHNNNKRRSDFDVTKSRPGMRGMRCLLRFPFTSVTWLTHFGPVTPYRIAELSHNWFMQCFLTWFSPLAYLNQCRYILNWTLKKLLQWNLNLSKVIFIQQNAFENVVCKMLANWSRH